MRKKEKNDMERKLNMKYSAIHFTSSGLMAITIAFASVFLLEKGFVNATIGAVLAVSSVLSIIFQTLLADHSNYLISYIVPIAGLLYILFYALVGSKNVNKDIPTE